MFEKESTSVKLLHKPRAVSAAENSSLAEE